MSVELFCKTRCRLIIIIRIFRVCLMHYIYYIYYIYRITVMIPWYSLIATWYVIMLCDYITKISPRISRLKLHTLINWSLYFKYFL